MESSADKPSLAELEVEELLKEVRVEYPPAEAVDAVLSAIRSCFQVIPEHQVTAALAPTFIQHLGVPPDKVNFTFKSPTHVEVVGSFLLQTMAKPEQMMDLAIHVPKSCFHEKDFLNHRYHAKRALYLAALKGHLEKCAFVKSIKSTLLHHDGRKPVLLLQLASGTGFTSRFNFEVLLVPVIGREIFNVAKLAPSRNNLRALSIGQQLGPQATPHYNASILEDMAMPASCSYIKSAILQHDGLRDAILLLKVWMRQRGFSSMLDSVNGFLMSMLVAYLIHSGECKISSNMNSLQIFRICIETLVSGRLEKGMFLNQADSKLDKEGKKAYFGFFDVVMMDTTDSWNVAFRLTKNAMMELKEAACGTIVAMKNSRDLGFDEVFMTPVDFAVKFDYHLRINMQSQPTKCPSFADEDKCRDVEKQVLKILSQGLGARASLVRVYSRVLPSNWEFGGINGLQTTQTLPIFVGILPSTFEAGYRMVDVGPSADNVDEAQKFRAFWGEKAELRRFKDGTINETAVWECDPTERHLIIQKIVVHLLQRHLSLACSDVFITASQLDHTLMVKKKDLSASVPKLLSAFDVLSKRMRSLKDLPLKISSIQDLHAAFRHAAVFPPEFHVLADERSSKCLSKDVIPACAVPCEVMIQLEGSGKWPTNEEAIAKTKVAFLLKIADSMERTYGVKYIAAEDAIDLLMYGFAFRLRVYYDRDPTLVQARQEKDHPAKNVAGWHERNTIVQPPTFEDDLLLRSLHASMLSGLQGRFPVYGPVVRLAKRWMGSHLFSGAVREEVVELLVAYLFLKPAPYSAPLSRMTGFLRFLLLLKNFNWELAPLIVDLNEDFSAKEFDVILDEFHRLRKQESNQSDQRGPAMFIATSYDMRSQTWSTFSPDQKTLKRLVAYARTSAELLSKLMKGESPERWPSLFCTPLSLYDVLLKIQPSKLPHPHLVLVPADVKGEGKVVVKPPRDDFKPWLSSRGGSVDVEKQLLVGFDPTLCLIKDLKAKFGNLFTYWYDAHGSTVVGLTWNSQSSKVSQKKRKRVQEDEELLIELGRLGAGFVESVHVVSTA